MNVECVTLFLYTTTYQNLQLIANDNITQLCNYYTTITFDFCLTINFS